MLPKDDKIIIVIEDYPIKWPLEMRPGGDVVFPSKFEYNIPEVRAEDTDGCYTIVHCGCTGSMSIEQIEKEFKIIIEYLKRRRTMFESVRVK